MKFIVAQSQIVDHVSLNIFLVLPNELNQVMYNIVFDKSAEKDLERLPNTTIKRVVKAIAKLEKEPLPIGVKKLQATDEDLYRIRVGDYRIIYSLKEVIKVVNVHKIRHRKEIYRNL